MTSAHRSRSLAFAAILAMCCASDRTIAAGQSDRASSGDDPVPKDLSWVDVAPAERVRVLDLLAAQAKGNYEKIKTWKVTYAYQMSNYLPDKVIADRFVGQFAPSEKVGALMQQTDYVIKFAIDISSGSVYRDKESSKMRFLRVGTDHAVQIPNVGPPDDRSVVTPGQYIRFNPRQTIPAPSNLPDHPEARNKRAAYVLPVDEGEHLEQGDRLDPRAFYSFDPANTFWSQLDLLSRALKGALDENQKHEAETRLTISQADGPGGSRWYRYRMNHSTPDNKSILWATQIWSSRAGFNPVHYLLAIGDAGGKPDMKIEWQWKVIDGIYIPSMVKESIYHAPDNGLSYERTSRLQECVLNQPLDSHQFDYQGLGMKDGDLLLNDVDRAVYKLQGGEPVKLGNYGDRQARSSPSDVKVSAKWLLAIGNAVILICLLTIFRKHLRIPKKS